MYPNPTPRIPLDRQLAAVTRGPTQLSIFGCLGSEPKARSQWFDALTLPGEWLVVKWSVPVDGVSPFSSVFHGLLGDWLVDGVPGVVPVHPSAVNTH